MTNEEYIKLVDAISNLEVVGQQAIRHHVDWTRFQINLDVIKTYVRGTYKSERRNNEG
jgi:hypothetical protein